MVYCPLIGEFVGEFPLEMLTFLGEVAFEIVRGGGKAPVVFAFLGGGEPVSWSFDGGAAFRLVPCDGLGGGGGVTTSRVLTAADLSWAGVCSFFLGVALVFVIPVGLKAVLRVVNVVLALPLSLLLDDEGSHTPSSAAASALARLSSTS